MGFVSSAEKLAPLLHLLVVSGEKEAKTEDFQSHQQILMLLQQQKKKKPVQVAAKQRLPKRGKRAWSCLIVTVMTRLTEYHQKQLLRKQKCKRNQKKTMEKQPRERKQRKEEHQKKRVLRQRKRPNRSRESKNLKILVSKKRS